MIHSGQFLALTGKSQNIWSSTGTVKRLFFFSMSQPCRNHVATLVWNRAEDYRKVREYQRIISNSALAAYSHQQQIVYGLTKVLEEVLTDLKETSILGQFLDTFFLSFLAHLGPRSDFRFLHPTWPHICINLHGCIRRAVPRHPEIQDAAGVASAIFCPCCTNCETRPFHLPEADCPIFALLVSRSASW